MLEGRPKPDRDRALNCPRCNSANTKFCYYNNYSFSQPRYFCKTCRRYWTEGGALRNVPVGGGSRKNKKYSSSLSSKTPSPSAFSMNLADLNTPTSFPQNPKNNIVHGGQDLNLAYPPTDHPNYNSISKFIETPFDQSENKTQIHQNTTSSMGFSSFIAMAPEGGQSTGFPRQESKQTLNLSFDGFHENELQGSSNNNGARILFPVKEMKPQVSNTTTTIDYFLQNNRGQGESTGYWTELLSGGSW